MAIDVIGYLNEDEGKRFFQQAFRLLKSGGYLIIMTGNELFDLFALNSGTVDFFSKNFRQNVTDLLTEGQADRFANAHRKNPLNFKYELAHFGFKEIDLAFSQFHHSVPALINRASGGDLARARLQMRDHSVDPNAWPESDRWKALFNCSIFASLSQKI